MKFRVKECTKKQIKKRSKTTTGWVSDMTKMIGTTFEGVIGVDGLSIRDTKDCRWQFKPKWVEKVEEVKESIQGKIVKVKSFSKSEIEKIEKSLLSWTDDMTSMMGRTFIVQQHDFKDDTIYLEKQRNIGFWFKVDWVELVETQPKPTPKPIQTPKIKYVKVKKFTYEQRKDFQNDKSYKFGWVNPQTMMMGQKFTAFEEQEDRFIIGGWNFDKRWVKVKMEKV